MDPFQFGPFSSNIGTRRKNKEYVQAGSGFYAGRGKDVLICGSEPVDVEGAPGGFLVTPVAMSGGTGKDIYKFERDSFEWGFIADAGGGMDTVKFKRNSPFNPNFDIDENVRVDVILINNRDVLLTSTNLSDGGRENGVLLADPFGRLNKANRIEKVKFGKRTYNFKNLFNSIQECVSPEEYDNCYNEFTYSELNELGMLNFSGFDDLNALEDGSYIDIATYNNNLADSL